MNTNQTMDITLIAKSVEDIRVWSKNRVVFEIDELDLHDAMESILAKYQDEILDMIASKEIIEYLKENGDLK